MVHGKKATSLEVARRAGVSQSTVSRVFSPNAPNVSDDVRVRVLQAADELGYRPNAIARMMSTRQSNIVGIVMANITSPFYPHVLEKFLQRLQAMDRQVLLFTASDNQNIDALLPQVLSYQLDALIVTSATLSSEMAAQAQKSGTPVILFNRAVQDPGVSSVCADNVAGGRLAADVLLNTGHSRIGYVAGLLDTSTNQDREYGFASRLRERGVLHWQRAQGYYTYDSGFHAATTLLQQPVPVDGIFCANDIMALGALDAIRARGMQAGDDVSVIGFDDIPMAAWESYRLTTISQEVDTMIEKTIHLMIEKIDNPFSTSRVERVPVLLVARASVKNLRTREHSE
jgi:DNA-binding LacI/PurR family transcriptional regulator